MFCRPVIFLLLNRIIGTIQAAQGWKYFSAQPQAARGPCSGLADRNNGYPSVYKSLLTTHKRVLFCYLKHNTRCTR